MMSPCASRRAKEGDAGSAGDQEPCGVKGAIVHGMLGGPCLLESKGVTTGERKLQRG